MADRDIASQLAFETDAIRNESQWLKEQAARVTSSMDQAWPVMRQARERIRALERDLLELANAADAVGVRFFDTDTMEPEVEAMQKATQAARAALKI